MLITYQTQDAKNGYDVVTFYPHFHFPICILSEYHFCVKYIKSMPFFYISQLSVVTYLRCGGINVTSLIAKFTGKPTIKEFLKSTNNVVGSQPCVKNVQIQC